MNAITLLKQDHKTVRGLFREFEHAGDRAVQQKQRIADETFNELETHTALEEEIFYPAVAASKDDQEGQDLVREATEEHAVVKTLISELKGMTPDDEQFDAKFKVLTENVEHHIREEEGELFPHAERVFDENQLKDLGRRMADRKQTLNAPSMLGETLRHARNFVAQAYDAVVGNGTSTPHPRRRSRPQARKSHAARTSHTAKVTPKKRTAKTSPASPRRTARTDSKAHAPAAVRKMKRTIKTSARAVKRRVSRRRTTKKSSRSRASK